MAVVVLWVADGLDPLFSHRAVHLVGAVEVLAVMVVDSAVLVVEILVAVVLEGIIEKYL